MTFKELLVKIGFDLTGKDKLDKTEQALEGIKRRLEFLTGIEIAKGVFELAERFSKFAEEIHIAAESAGITAEAFQKLAFAAGQNAVSQDEMSGAMARLSRHLYDARRGGAEAAKVFADAGFTPTQIDRFHTGSDVMLALADRFKNIQDPIKKQAIAMELMGRGSINMVGFLSKGSNAIRGMGDEAERLGIVLSGAQVEALVQVEHSLQKLWGTVKGFSATIAALFGPSITFIIDKMLKFYEINHKLIQEGVESWAHKFAYAMGFIYGLIEDVVKATLKFADAHHTLTKAIFSTIFGFAGLISAAVLAIKVFSFFHSTFEQGVKLFNAAKLIWTYIAALKDLTIFTRIVTAATAAWDAVMGVLTAEIAFIEAPVWAVIAVLGVLTIAIHDLYVWFFKGGSFEDTWIGKGVGALKNLWGWFKKAGGAAEDAISNSGAVNDLQNGAANLQSLQAMNGAPSTVGGASSSVANQNNEFSMNAPITVNVPSGTDARQVAKAAQDGVRQHLDRVHREASRMLRPTEAY